MQKVILLETQTHTKVAYTSAIAVSAAVAISSLAFSLSLGMASLLSFRIAPFSSPQFSQPSFQTAATKTPQEPRDQSFASADIEQRTDWNGKTVTHTALPRNISDKSAMQTEEIRGYIFNFGESILTKQNKTRNDFKLGKFKGNIQNKLIQDKTGALNLHKNKKDSVIKYLAQSKQKKESEISEKIKNVYTKTLNGIFIDEIFLTAKNIQDLKAQGITVYPSKKYSATLMDSVGVIHALNIDENGDDCTVSGKKCLSGENVKVGVIDTGVDYTHPDLGHTVLPPVEFTKVTESPIEAPVWNFTTERISLNKERLAYFRAGDIYVQDLSSGETKVFDIPLEVSSIEKIAIDGDIVAYAGVKALAPAPVAGGGGGPGVRNLGGGDEPVPGGGNGGPGPGGGQPGPPIKGFYAYTTVSTGEFHYISETDNIYVLGVSQGRIVYIKEFASDGVWNKNIYVYDTQTQSEYSIADGPFSANARDPRIDGDIVAYSNGVSSDCASDPAHLILYNLVTQNKQEFIPPNFFVLHDFQGDKIIYLPCPSMDRYNVYDIKTKQATPLDPLNTGGNVQGQGVFVEPIWNRSALELEDNLIYLSNQSQVFIYDQSLNRYAYLNRNLPAHDFATDGRRVCIVTPDFIISCHIYSAEQEYPSPTPFNKKVAGGYDFVNRDSDPMDDHGHGTHVAGIIGSNGSLKGVAPDSKLYAYKVLDSGGNGYDYNIVSAIESAVDPNRDGNFDDKLDIINLSLGGYGAPDDPLVKAVNTASQSGITVVVAAGNSGPGGRPDCPGEGDDRVGSVCSPAIAKHALTVGATYKKNYTGRYWLDEDPLVDQVTSFSSRGPARAGRNNGTLQFLMKPDVVAPGAIICSARYDTIFPPGEHPHYFPCNNDEEHVQIAGTSMAAPVTAGAAALLKERNPEWSPDQIKYALRNSADDTGKSHYLQGFGRINVQNALKISRPLIAQMDPVTMLGNQFTLTGTLDGDNLARFEVYYSYGLTGNFILLDTKTISAPRLNTRLYQGSVDRWLLGNGYLTFKIALYDKAGNSSADVGVVKVENYKFLSPFSNDIYRPGVKISIMAKMPPRYRYTIEVGSGHNPTQWSKDGITQGRNGDVVGSWDTSSIHESGFYTLRLTMTYRDRQFIEKAQDIYLDTTLKEGWPKFVPLDTKEGEIFTFFSGGGFLEPVVADVDNDKRKEIIVFRSGIKNILYVYRDDGSLYWSKELDSALLEPNVLGSVDEPIPIVTDLNNDGLQEIIVLNFANAIDTETYYYTASLVIFDSKGNLFEQMDINPILLSPISMPSMIVSDLNHDNAKEIIIRSNGNFSYNYIKILNSRGREIVHQNLPSVSWFADIMSIPAVGNFDDDSDLEIVVAGPGEGAGWDPIAGRLKQEGFVSIYNLDGSVVSNWPVKTENVIFSSPVVGDINHDGKDDIVIGLFRNDDDQSGGGIYVFDRYGKILDGFPAETGWNYWATPALSDYNYDGYLEIAASRIGFVNYLIDWQGKTLWTSSMPWNSYYSMIAADVTGDGQEEILTASDNGFYGFGEFLNGKGGVHAFDIMNGQELTNGFPKVTETAAQAPIVVDDIDNDGLAEIVASSKWNYDMVKFDFKLRSSVYVWDIDATSSADAMPWPQFHHDVGRTGLYVPSRPLGINTPPTVNIIFPNAGDIVSGSIDIKAKAEDRQGMSKVEFYLDDQRDPFSVDSETSDNIFTAFLNTENLNDGRHTVWARAYNIVGLTADSAKVDFEADNIPPDPVFLRGDSNGDGKVDISDPVYILNHLFQGGRVPLCEDSADSNDDGFLDIGDAVRMFLYLYSDQVTELAPPGAIIPGPDPTADGLGCALWPATQLNDGLTVSADAITLPARQVVFGSAGVPLTDVRLKAGSEDIDITKLRILVANGALSGTAYGTYHELSRFYLKIDGNLIGNTQGYTSLSETIINLDRGTLTIPRGNTGVKFTILGDITNQDTNPLSAPNASIRVGLGGRNGIQAIGNSSSQAPVLNYSDSTSSPVILHRAVPQVTFGAPNNRLGALSLLHTSKITAIGDDIGIYRLTYLVATSTFVQVNNGFVRLAFCSGCGGITDGSQLANPQENGRYFVDGYSIFTFAVDPFQSHGKPYLKIARGATALLEFSATVSLTTLDDKVYTSLLGDSPTSTNDVWGSEANAYRPINQGNFVWSDLNGDDSQAATSLTAKQWYNGYLVDGLGETPTSTPEIVGE